MSTNLQRWLLLVPLALIWGSSFMLIKRGLVGMTFLEVGAFRLFCASVFLLLIGAKYLKDIPLYKWKFLILTALCGSFFPAFLFAIGQTHISPPISAVLNSLTPVNALIIGIFFYSLDYKRIQLVGVFLGVLGSLLLIFGGGSANLFADLGFAALVYLACVLYAMNVNFIKAYLSDIKPLAISAGNAAVMLVPTLCLLKFSGFQERIEIDAVRESALYILILGVVGTGIANILFFRLIQVSSPVFASSVTYLIPVVAFGWGLIDGDKMDWVQGLGALVVICGVYLSSRK